MCNLCKLIQEQPITVDQLPPALVEEYRQWEVHDWNPQGFMVWRSRSWPNRNAYLVAEDELRPTSVLMDVAEANRWFDTVSRSYCVAASWFLNGFTPEEATTWRQYGFQRGHTAHPYRDAPPQLVKWLRADDAKKWWFASRNYTARAENREPGCRMMDPTKLDDYLTGLGLSMDRPDEVVERLTELEERFYLEPWMLPGVLVPANFNRGVIWWAMHLDGRWKNRNGVEPKAVARAVSNGAASRDAVIRMKEMSEASQGHVDPLFGFTTVRWDLGMLDQVQVYLDRYPNIPLGDLETLIRNKVSVDTYDQEFLQLEAEWQVLSGSAHRFEARVHFPSDALRTYLDYRIQHGAPPRRLVERYHVDNLYGRREVDRLLGDAGITLSQLNELRRYDVEPGYLREYVSVMDRLPLDEYLQYRTIGATPMVAYSLHVQGVPPEWARAWMEG